MALLTPRSVGDANIPYFPKAWAYLLAYSTVFSESAHPHRPQLLS
jgi:hypothetical protein